MSVSPFVMHDARCGLCGFTFEAVVPRPKASTLRWRDTDHCPHYEGPNPVFYAIWVCHSCHFVPYREDFSLSPGKFRDSVQEVLAAGAPSAQACAFDQGERSLFAALTSYQLALTCYEGRKAPPDVLGSVALRAGWICRYASELRREIGFLAKARDLYVEAFEQGVRRDARADDLAVGFMVGELLLRTGRIGEAGPYFRMVAEARDSGAAQAAMAAERERDVKKTQRTREWLVKVPLFAPLGERGLSLLAVYAAERTFKPGAIVFDKGVAGEAMYVVMEGEVRLDPPTATLGPGETFGEMTLFTGERHRETAVAWQPPKRGDRILLLEISKIVFRNLVKAVPDVALRVAVAMSQRYARLADGFPATETLPAGQIV